MVAAILHSHDGGNPAVDLGVPVLVPAFMAVAMAEVHCETPEGGNPFYSHGDCLHLSQNGTSGACLPYLSQASCQR